MSNLEELFSQVIEATNDVIVITKADNIEPPGPEIVYVNKAFERLTGYSAEEAIGQSPRMLQSEDTAPEDRARIKQALKNKHAVRSTIQNISKDGRSYFLDISIIPLKDADGNVTHFAAIERDVSEQKALQHHLEKLSRTDGLTGLLNHRAFHAELEKEASRIRRKNTPGVVSLLILDIDHFKQVNDNFGHDAGDKVLREFARLIEQQFRKVDCAGRLGGEEFSVVLPSTGAQQAKVSAERFRNLIANHKFVAEEVVIPVTVSIGIAEYREGDSDYNCALKRADQALYEAKHNGRNRTCIYTSGKNAIELEASE